VTSIPSYPSYPAAPQQLTGPAAVQVAVAEVARQSRATVAFRLILAIPHLFVLYFLAIAACVVVFIGWWGALFMGRLPDFAANYLSAYMRWYARVYGYVFLLTDVYPPFALEDGPGYPVRLAVMAQERLNRLAVFFRIILAIPAGIVAGAAIAGATLVSIIAWLVTLITGQLPDSLHLAFTAVLRYHFRYYCYWLLLTPTYPGGLFGDAAGAPGYVGEPPAPGYDAPRGYGTPRPVFQPASWRLTLSSAARGLVVLFLALGALIWIGVIVVDSIAATNATNRSSTVNTANHAIDQLNNSYGTLTSNLTKWQATVKACDTNFTCVTKADGDAAAYFSTFASQLQATPMPSGAAAAASKLHSDATQAARDFTRLSKATTVSQYQKAVASTALQQTLDTFDQDFNALGTALENT
jgi:hypothetical protein